MSGGGGLYSLATIIKRLEAATSRIEDIVHVQDGLRPASRAVEGTNVPTADTNTSAPAAPVPPPPPPPPPPAPAAAPPAEDPRSVLAFDEVILEGKLKPFIQATREFPCQALIEQVDLIEREFQTLRSVILMASFCQKPEQKTWGETLSPLQGNIEAITRLKEANRKDRNWFTHMSTVSEGAPVVGWITVELKPAPYVKDIVDSTMFYGNRVIKEFKDKEPKHAEWVKAYVALLEEVRKYILEHHTTGLVWNPKGTTVEQYLASNKAPAAGAAPPPPPPPPPPPALAPQPPAAAPTASGPAAVFAELNRGEEVTKGLRKVDKSEMTHKNPALRASSVVPAASTPPKKPTKPAKPHALAGKKPPKFALEGSKWVIEYQENEQTLVVEEGQINQTVNLYKCNKCTIQIKGKVNAVTLVGCEKTSVLVDSVISSISVTNSPSFALQITGTAPTIQLDSTVSGQIYLSKDCLGTEITTAKCSSINVSLPVPGEEEGVFEEQAVPEMLKTVIKDGKLVTTVVEHVG